VGRLVSYCLGAGGAGSDDDDDDDEARSCGGDDGEARPRQRRRIAVITEGDDEASDVRVRSFAALRPMAALAAERLATSLDLAEQLRAVTADRTATASWRSCAAPRPAAEFLASRGPLRGGSASAAAAALS